MRLLIAIKHTTADKIRQNNTMQMSAFSEFLVFSLLCIKKINNKPLRMVINFWREMKKNNDLPIEVDSFAQHNCHQGEQGKYKTCHHLNVGIKKCFYVIILFAMIYTTKFKHPRPFYIFRKRYDQNTLYYNANKKILK